MPTVDLSRTCPRTNKEKTMTTQAKEVEVVKHEAPADLISQAISKGADLDKLEKLLTLQERWEKNEARKAYNEAISAFKENPPRVTKDKQNSQYKSMYTTLGNLVNTVNPELSKHGLSASWEIKQANTIEVTCILTHRMGHSERATASAPADNSGSKNAIQQIKSTVTYLKAVTYESIIGLASSDANYDDDGNSASNELIDSKQLNQLLDMIADKEVDPKKFLAYLKLESLETMPKSMFQKAMAALEQKKKASK